MKSGNQSTGPPRDPGGLTTTDDQLVALAKSGYELLSRDAFDPEIALDVSPETLIAHVLTILTAPTWFARQLRAASGIADKGMESAESTRCL
jgi:hypothetical protein